MDRPGEERPNSWVDQIIIRGVRISKTKDPVPTDQQATQAETLPFDSRGLITNSVADQAQKCRR
jgi:hypothetical protein